MIGLKINTVEPGTVLDHEGEQFTVDDANCVQLNDELYVTPATAAAMRKRVPVRHPATSIGE